MADATIVVPRLGPSDDAGEEGWVERGTGEYRLISFPFEPYRLMGGKNQPDAQEAENLRAWMEAEEAGRARLALQTLCDCGAPISHLPLATADYLALTPWINAWFPTSMARWRGEPRESHWWVDHHGHVQGYWFPGSDGYSSEANWFEVSVAHDLTFLVAQTVRTVLPDLEWRVSPIRLTPDNPSDTRYHLPILHPAPPLLVPTLESLNILRRSLSNDPRGEEDRQNALSILVHRLVSGM
jgi:hypothetical protein